jgi:hypothetical protein
MARTSNIQWNDDEVHFVSDQRTELDVFLVLAHWNNSLLIDMSLQSDTLLWYRANQSLLWTASLISVLTWSVVDRGFESLSYQTKDYNIGICCFLAKHCSIKEKEQRLVGSVSSNAFSLHVDLVIDLYELLGDPAS